jgi:hypothetical protein
MQMPSAIHESSPLKASHEAFTHYPLLPLCRLTSYGFDSTSLVELHQTAGTSVEKFPACIVLDLARKASTAGHGCILFVAKDVMAAIQLQLVSQSHVGLNFVSRGLG